MEHRYYGKYKSFVRDNDDPERRGRLRLLCPQIMGNEDVASSWLGWAEPCLPWIGGLPSLDFGAPYSRGQNGDDEIGVWVEFQGGLLDFPIWVGCFIVAPTATDARAQVTTTDVKGAIGGSIIANPGGSELAALDPPTPQISDETRLLVKKGRDIVLGSQDGGFIVIGPSGVQLSGVQVTINGKLFDALTDENYSG
jgi:hypothetical protein